jgi:hypothetical protein
MAGRQASALGLLAFVVVFGVAVVGTLAILAVGTLRVLSSEVVRRRFAAIQESRSWDL